MYEKKKPRANKNVNLFAWRERILSTLAHDSVRFIISVRFIASGGGKKKGTLA